MEIENFLVKNAKKEGIQKLVVGGVIRNEKGEYLILSRKTDDFMGGIDEIPSGKVEMGESLFDAIQREVKEESGIEIDYISSYIDYFDYLSSSGKKSRQFNFEVVAKDTNYIILSEHDSYKWQDIEECNNNIKITSKTLTTINIAEFNKKLKSN